MSVRFRYRAATPDGQVVEGVVHAPSRQSVLEQLRHQRLYPVTVDEATAAAGARVGRRLGRRAAVTLWTRNAATLLAAGVPLDRALAFTAQYASHNGLAETVRQVRRAVQGGASLADALARHPRYFDPLFIAMVSATSRIASAFLKVIFPANEIRKSMGTSSCTISSVPPKQCMMPPRNPSYEHSSRNTCLVSSFASRLWMMIGRSSSFATRICRRKTSI